MEPTYTSGVTGTSWLKFSLTRAILPSTFLKITTLSADATGKAYYMHFLLGGSWELSVLHRPSSPGLSGAGLAANDTLFQGSKVFMDGQTDMTGPWISFIGNEVEHFEMATMAKTVNPNTNECSLTGQFPHILLVCASLFLASSYPAW
eukprot:Nk52_evm32s233 gene=Nk52_evmTU32s233